MRRSGREKGPPAASVGIRPEGSISAERYSARGDSKHSGVPPTIISRRQKDTGGEGFLLKVVKPILSHVVFVP